MDQTDVWLRYVAALTTGMTQDQIARTSVVSQGTISRWVNGRKLPTEAAKVAAFARGFNRNVLEAFVAAGMLSVREADQGLDPTSLQTLAMIGVAEAGPALDRMAGPGAERVDLWTEGPAVGVYYAGPDEFTGCGIEEAEAVTLQELEEGTDVRSRPAPDRPDRRQ